MVWQDVLSRAARTFLQAFIGVFIALTATSGIAEVPSLDTLQKAGLAALWAGFVALLSFAQNALEDAHFIPALFGKATPADTRDIRTDL